jgi:hypothetical protein
VVAEINADSVVSDINDRLIPPVEPYPYLNDWLPLSPSEFNPSLTIHNDLVLELSFVHGAALTPSQCEKCAS